MAVNVAGLGPPGIETRLAPALFLEGGETEFNEIEVCWKQRWRGRGRGGSSLRSTLAFLNLMIPTATVTPRVHAKTN